MRSRTTHMKLLSKASGFSLCIFYLYPINAYNNFYFLDILFSFTKKSSKSTFQDYWRNCKTASEAFFRIFEYASVCQSSSVSHSKYQKCIVKHNVMNVKMHEKQENFHTLLIRARASSPATSQPPLVQIWVINLLPTLLASVRMLSKYDAERPKVGFVRVSDGCMQSWRK
jgi:hypothetical protein